jgi:anti-anti-sigma regulatory factor
MNDASAASVGSSPAALFHFDEQSIDATNYGKIAAALRSATEDSNPLVLDWSTVSYIDFLGLEMVLDFILIRSGLVAFAGLNRSIRHLLSRMQLLHVLPNAETCKAAAELLLGGKE